MTAVSNDKHIQMKTQSRYNLTCRLAKHTYEVPNFRQHLAHEAQIRQNYRDSLRGTWSGL